MIYVALAYGVGLFLCLIGVGAYKEVVRLRFPNRKPKLLDLAAIFWPFIMIALTIYALYLIPVKIGRLIAGRLIKRPAHKEVADL